MAGFCTFSICTVWIRIAYACFLNYSKLVISAITKMYLVTEPYSMPILCLRIFFKNNCSLIHTIFRCFFYLSTLFYKQGIYDSLLYSLSSALRVPNIPNRLRILIIPRCKHVPQYLPFLKSVPSPEFSLGQSVAEGLDDL